MRTRTRRTTAVTALVLAAVIALAACGGDDDSSSSDSGGAYATSSSETTAAQATTATTTAAGSGGTTTLDLKAEPDGALAFDTDTLTAKAGKVTLDLTNPEDAGIPHAIAIEGQGVDEDGQVAQPGGSSTVTATLKPGTYVFYCPVAGHREGGMKGTLTVN